MAIWDTAYHDAMPAEDDTSEVGRLIYAIYDFTTVPFYGAFQPVEILGAYVSICTFLRGSGVECPKVARFTEL